MCVNWFRFAFDHERNINVRYQVLVSSQNTSDGTLHFLSALQRQPISPVVGHGFAVGAVVLCNCVYCCVNKPLKRDKSKATMFYLQLVCIRKSRICYWCCIERDCRFVPHSKSDPNMDNWTQNIKFFTKVIGLFVLLFSLYVYPSSPYWTAVHELPAFIEQFLPTGTGKIGLQNVADLQSAMLTIERWRHNFNFWTNNSIPNVGSGARLNIRFAFQLNRIDNSQQQSRSSLLLLQDHIVRKDSSDSTLQQERIHHQSNNDHTFFLWIRQKNKKLSFTCGLQLSVCLHFFLPLSGSTTHSSIVQSSRSSQPYDHFVLDL